MSFKHVYSVKIIFIGAREEFCPKMTRARVRWQRRRLAFDRSEKVVFRWNWICRLRLCIDGYRVTSHES